MPDEAIESKKRAKRIRTTKSSKAERTVIAEMVDRNDGVVSAGQVKALSVALNRTPRFVQQQIVKARNRFLESADHYVDVHRQAVDTALNDGSVAGLEQAIKGSQWAIERMSHDGVSVVEKVNSDAASGVKVMIGVQIGGSADASQASDK